MQIEKKQPAYLLVEGVNLGEGIFDTDQLSVVRGGSFLYREAITKIEKEFETELEPLSTGASSGLFKLIDSQADPAAIGSKIQDYLKQHKDYQYLNFIAVHTRHADFQTAKERLIALLRYQQMQSLSGAPDPLIEGEVTTCSLHGRRAAPDPVIEHKSLSIRLYADAEAQSAHSPSVRCRYLVGVQRRHEYYRNMLRNIQPPEVIKTLNFTQDIQTLATDESFTRLNQKIAVLYLDGNGFTGIQKKLVKNSDDQKEFDEDIQTKRRQLLSQLLRNITDDPQTDFLNPFAPTEHNPNNSDKPDKLLRFETLLWGGDEMLFVMPAWMGMDVMQEIFRLTQGWNYKGEKLTHAAGLVFCHCKTPIYRMRQLAEKLANEVKETKQGREANLYQYVVLESVDFPSEGSPSDYFKNRYGKLGTQRKPLAPCPEWRTHRDEYRQLLQQHLSKGQIHRLTRALVQGADEKVADEKVINNLEQRLCSLLDAAQRDTLYQLLDKLFSGIAPDSKPADTENSDSPLTAHKQPWSWLHLMILWDYLAPRQNAHSQTQLLAETA